MASATVKERQKEIGKRIGLARKEAGGMTQDELAALIKVAPRTMQAYEQGEIVPYKYLRDLERILNRPAAWFLHGDAVMVAPDKLHEEVMASLREMNAKLDRLLAVAAL